MKRNSCMVVVVFLVILAAIPAGLAAADDVVLTGVFQGTSYNTHFHPTAGKIVTQDGKEYQVVDNEAAHDLYHVTEGKKIKAVGRISEGPEGKQIEMKSFTVLN